MSVLDDELKMLISGCQLIQAFARKNRLPEPELHVSDEWYDFIRHHSLVKYYSPSDSPVESVNGLKLIRKRKN